MSQHHLLDSPSFSVTRSASFAICGISMYVWNCFWLFYSILLVCLPIPHFTNYYSFTVKAWIAGRTSSFIFSFFFKIVLVFLALCTYPYSFFRSAQNYTTYFIETCVHFSPPRHCYYCHVFYLYICYKLHNTIYYKGGNLTYLPM